MKRFEVLIPFFRKYKWRYVIGVCALLIVNVCQLIIPRILGEATDALEQGQLIGSLLARYIFFIVGAAIIIAVGRFTWRIHVSGTSRTLEYYLRDRFFQHLLTLSPSFYHEHKTGDLMAHATNDINAIRMALGFGVVMLVDALFLTVLTVVSMFSMVGWQLTTVALLPMPFMAFVVTRFGRLIHRRFRQVQEAFSDLTDVAQENLNGIRVVKAFVQEQAETDKFDASNRHNIDRNMHLVRIWGLFMPLVQFIGGISFLAVLAYGGVQVIEGRISLGQFVAFNSFLMLLMWPMMALGFMANTLQRGMASLDRLNAIFRIAPAVKDVPGTTPLREVRGELEFRNLTFSYGRGEPVLKNITLKVNAGETLAVVGPTGSGKTTLVNLLLRLYDPPRDTVFLDGVDITSLPLEQLRTAVGYVPQDNFLFSTTVAGNIAFAHPAERSAIEEAARDAQVYDNIVEFPQGFDTVVGERGVSLSGGQRQRVSIARALIKNPTVLILDDALSAVDTHTEEEILKRLAHIMEARTSIVIAHRISTVKDADLIVVLDEGEIKERGTHASLLAENGIYADMHRRQLLEEQIRSA